MTKIKDDLVDSNSFRMLYQADLDLLTSTMGGLVNMNKEVNEWNQQDYTKLLVTLDKFYSIHSTRTQDLLVCLERFEKAKLEYTKLKHAYEELKNLNQKQEKIISELLTKN